MLDLSPIKWGQVVVGTFSVADRNGTIFWQDLLSGRHGYRNSVTMAADACDKSLNRYLREEAARLQSSVKPARIEWLPNPKHSDMLDLRVNEEQAGCLQIRPRGQFAYFDALDKAQVEGTSADPKRECLLLFRKRCQAAINAIDAEVQDA